MRPTGWVLLGTLICFLLAGSSSLSDAESGAIRRRILNLMKAIPENTLDDLTNYGPDAFAMFQVQEAIASIPGIIKLESTYFMMAFFEMLVLCRIDLPTTIPADVCRWAKLYGFEYLEWLAEDAQMRRRHRRTHQWRALFKE